MEEQKKPIEIIKKMEMDKKEIAIIVKSINNPKLVTYINGLLKCFIEMRA